MRYVVRSCPCDCSNAKLSDAHREHNGEAGIISMLVMAHKLLYMSSVAQKRIHVPNPIIA